MPPRKIPATVSPSSTPAVARARRAPPLPRSALPPTSAGVQVNFCKNPTCANFGVPVPMQKTPGVKGTYKLIGAGANKGSIHVRCSLCNEKIPMKSNAGIVEELARMQAPLAALKPTCCPHATCSNHGVPVGTAGAYKAFGHNSAGNPRWMCKACGRTFSRALDPAKWQETSSKNRLIFKLLVSDTPLARIADVVELDERTIGRRVKFIHRQVVAFAAAREAKLAELEIPRLYISADGQEQIINWRDKEDRRNVVLSAIASVDNPTGYCFGMHLNFDPSLDRAAIEAQAARIGDQAKPTPLRRFSRLWLEADYAVASAQKAVRARMKAAKSAQAVPAPGLAGAIDAAYAAQQEREDIEAPEEADGFFVRGFGEDDDGEATLRIQEQMEEPFCAGRVGGGQGQPIQAHAAGDQQPFLGQCLQEGRGAWLGMDGAGGADEGAGGEIGQAAPEGQDGLHAPRPLSLAGILPFGAHGPLVGAVPNHGGVGADAPEQAFEVFRLPVDVADGVEHGRSPGRSLEGTSPYSNSPSARMRRKWAPVAIARRREVRHGEPNFRACKPRLKAVAGGRF